jgi:hypothetical protein
VVPSGCGREGPHCRRAARPPLDERFLHRADAGARAAWSATDPARSPVGEDKDTVDKSVNNICGKGCEYPPWTNSDGRPLRPCVSNTIRHLTGSGGREASL